MFTPNFDHLYSRIFKNSRYYNRLLSGELNGILLADNGYGIAPFCLTPFLNPENEEEEHYNLVHKRARTTVERAFGQLKRRFHCTGNTMRISGYHR